MTGFQRILSQILIYGERIQDAIEVFLLNTVLFPQDANVYDSLGESYMLNNQKELAIKNYQKSLELNPKSQNAKKMLEKLNVKK
jgi:tetratricopeptide (TPR) repeat protein